MVSKVGCNLRLPHKQNILHLKKQRKLKHKVIRELKVVKQVKTDPYDLCRRTNQGDRHKS